MALGIDGTAHKNIASGTSTTISLSTTIAGDDVVLVPDVFVVNVERDDLVGVLGQLQPAAHFDEDIGEERLALVTACRRTTHPHPRRLAAA